MKKEVKRRWRCLWDYAKPYKWSFFNAFFCILATSFISMFYPYIFGILVNEVLYSRNMTFFVVVIAVYTIVFFTEQFLHCILAMTWPYQYNTFLLEVRKKIYRKMLALRYQKLTSLPVGDMVSQINWEAESFIELIHRNLAYLLSCTIKLIVIVLIVFFIDWQLGVFMVIMVPVSYMISFYLGKKIGKEQNKVRDSYVGFISWCFEMILGIREIKLFNAQDSVMKQCIEKSEDIIEKNYNVARKEIISDRVCAFFVLLTNVGVYILAALSIYNGRISLGNFMAVVTYFALANEMLVKINKFWGKIHSNYVFIDKIIDLFEMDSEEREENKPDISIRNGDISFDDVCFSYDGKHTILEHFDMHITSGEHVALVGRSGAGKSTCAGLLLGFFLPSSGSISIDGMSIADCNLTSLRNAIGVVQQEIFIFDGTIRQNLSIVFPEATDEMIYDALRSVALYDYVSSLPDGLDTVIGQDGINMSGGEKQRLAIARMFLTEKKLFIFDEATSSLDFESENAINNALVQLSENKTCIIIAHRLSTVLNAEKIILIDNGKMIASGTHSELYENCTEYHDLFEDQYLSKEKINSEK